MQEAHELHDALPEYTVAVGAWDWEGVENKKVEIDLDKASSIPIKRDRRQSTEQECLVFLIAARPKKIWALIGDEHLRWYEAGNDCPLIGAIGYISECHSWCEAR